MPALDEVAHQPDRALLLAAALIQQAVEHHPCAALDDPQQVAKVEGRVGVPDRDARRVGALELEQVQLRQPDVAVDRVRQQRQPRRRLRLAGGAMRPLLDRRDPALLDADLADQPGPDPVAASPSRISRMRPGGEVAHGRSLDPLLGAVVRRPIPAARHHAWSRPSARPAPAAAPARGPRSGVVASTMVCPPAARNSPTSSARISSSSVRSG